MKAIDFYRTLKCLLPACLIGGVGALNSHGQFTFQSSSDGSYGPMNITTNTTLQMPTNGIFNCSSITIASNATLRFNPNVLNTPVYLLATNDVIIHGTIDVSGVGGTATNGGVGGPGGFRGGNPANVLLGRPPSDGCGPGAGRAGTNGIIRAGYASYGTAAFDVDPASQNGAVYGSPLLVPLVGGSGGGGTGVGGAGGGGAILIASSASITLVGSLVAGGGGGSPFGGVGSGGAIRLVAPAVSGSGSLDVSGYGDGMHIGGSGAGRIRVDCMLGSSVAFNFAPSSVASVGANMVVFLTNAPHLDITQVAGNNIPVGTNAPVFFMLPQDSPTNQTVTVRASNFAAQVPIRVVLTPDNGSSSYYDTNIDNTVSPASVTVPVVVPVNVLVHVNAWTR